MKKITNNLFKKEITSKRLISGGKLAITLTGCSWTASKQQHDCTGTDLDQPTTSSLL